MTATPQSVIVVGAGIFGVTAALELRRRGCAVSLFDPGPLPSTRASSTDTSKIIRMDYGADEFYTELMEVALARWEAWNRQWSEPLYHPAGILFATRQSMQPGSFEWESFVRLQKRGHSLHRLDSATLKARFPAIAAGSCADGYFNPRAGWAASGKVVAWLLGEARDAGVALREGKQFARLLEKGSQVAGIVTADGEAHPAGTVIVAAGAWTPALLPHLQSRMWATGQPLMFFRAPNHTDHQPPRFACFAADISQTGWYVLPALSDGTVKVGHHGRGLPVHPDDSREVPQEVVGSCREFLRHTLPDLAGAPLTGTRLCFYCDTWDGNFWIDGDPERPGLVVAAGGSGHAFKFAPVLGEIIADVVEGKPNPYASRFAWRDAGDPKAEGTRHRGEVGSVG